MATYHLYMDEAGEFEGQKERIRGKKRRPPIFGLLVEEQVREQLRGRLHKAAREQGFDESFIHATQANRQSGYPRLAADMVSLLRDSEGISSSNMIFTRLWPFSPASPHVTA